MNSLIIFAAKYLIYILILIAAGYIAAQNKKRQKEILFLAAIILPVSYVVAKIASFFYYDPRPFVVGGFTPLIPHAADNGFPSDHTLLASAVAAVIFGFHKKFGTLLFVLAVLVGLGRVLAGVHHGLDVAGSIIITVTVAFSAQRFLLERFSKN